MIVIMCICMPNACCVVCVYVCLFHTMGKPEHTFFNAVVYLNKSDKVKSYYMLEKYEKANETLCCLYAQEKSNVCVSLDTTNHHATVEQAVLHLFSKLCARLSLFDPMLAQKCSHLAWEMSSSMCRLCRV